MPWHKSQHKSIFHESFKHSNQSYSTFLLFWNLMWVFDMQNTSKRAHVQYFLILLRKIIIMNYMIYMQGHNHIQLTFLHVSI